DFATGELVHPDAVVGVQFTGGGDRLATACADRFLRVFAISGEAATGKPLFDPVPYYQQTPGPLQAFLDQDRGLLTWNEETQAIWRAAETGDPLRTIPCPKNGLKRAIRVVPSPDGKYIAVVANSQAQMWDVRARRPVGPALPSAK